MARGPAPGEQPGEAGAEAGRPLLKASWQGEACRWLLEAGETEVLAALAELARRRPGLLRRAAAADADLEAAWQAPAVRSDRKALGLPRLLRRAAGAFNPAELCPARPLPVLPQLVAPQRPEAHEPAEPAERPSPGRFRRSRAAEWQQRCREQSAEWGPIVQFSSCMYFCEMEEGSVTLSVVRLGHQGFASEVRYVTRESSAKASSAFEETSGTLVFAPGESLCDIQIPLVQRKEWTPTLDFVVELQEEGAVNAVLGRYGWQARVKVDSGRPFPSARHQRRGLSRTKSHRALARSLEEVPGGALLLEYVKLNWLNPVVRIGSIKTLLKDQCHNLYFVMRLFLNVFLVDFVLRPLAPEGQQVPVQDRTRSLVLIMAAMVVPFALLHYLDYRSPGWRVPGASRLVLQRALLGRFLHYEEASRLDLRQGDLVMAMTRDTVGLVGDGFVNLLNLAAQLGKLLMLLVYQVTAPIAFGKPMAIAVVLPLVLFPALLVSFLAARRLRSTSLLKAQNFAQNRLVEHVENTVANFRLVADYGRRTAFVDRLEEHVQAFNVACVEVQQAAQNDLYFSRWLTTASVAAYTLVGGTRVLSGFLPLGMFLTNIHALVQVGEAWGRIYGILREVQMIFPGLQRIVFLMNLPIDLPERAELARHCSETTHLLRETIERDAARGCRLDRLPIMLEDLTCSYTVRGPKGELCYTVDVHIPGSLVLEQGHFVSVIGPGGSGKTTLLKAVGGAVLPNMDRTAGFFIPSHLRVLHVGTEPSFFHGTLRANLAFGVGEGDPDGSAGRVCAICRRLGLPEGVVRFVASEEQLAWGEVVSLTQRHLLCIARALVANPDVLVMHKPTLAFDERTSVKVLGLLKDFVVRRGVEQEAGTWNRRRPRTCIITSSKMHGVEIADQVFHISSDGGIRQLDKAEVTPDMFV